MLSNGQKTKEARRDKTFVYAYTYDETTGGLLLNSTPLSFSKEPRPVYYEELDTLGFDQFWTYEKDASAPYLWAEANNYFYRGRKVAKTVGGSCYTAPKIEILEEPEPDGTPLRPVDLAAMVEKNRDILNGLVQDTIKKVYNTYIQYEKKIDVFYVAFSGGKDSVVALDIVQRALPHNAFKVMFGDTGMEFPDTYQLMDVVRQRCKNAGIHFYTANSRLQPLEAWHLFGPPSQKIRWCCSVHKSAPQVLLLRGLTKNPNFRGMAFTGVRGAESATRNTYDEVTVGKKVRGQYSCHVILEWNSAEVFSYIYAQKLCLNEAYKKGNSRAGCLVCPLATAKNIFFKEQSYRENAIEARATSSYNDIILQTSAKDFSTPDDVKEFMNIGGWKARRSGKELSIAKRIYEDTFDKGCLTIKIKTLSDDWKEWIKTVGVIVASSSHHIVIDFMGKQYRLSYRVQNNQQNFKVRLETNTKQDILFLSALKIVLKKTAYCVNCGVCEANCPHGCISFDENRVKISEKCVRCRKCHEIDFGCLRANSLRLPKGASKMGSIDRYGNMGIEFHWVKKYFEKKDAFWESPHGLGTNMVKYLRYFLNDSGVTQNSKFTHFGAFIDSIGVNDTLSWAMMLCNLAYNAEFRWWIHHTNVGETYTPERIQAMLDDALSHNTKSHIVSAFKNIFISIPQLGEGVGLGKCDYDVKNRSRRLHFIVRDKWQNPDARVILYSLYKFAENCGGYYQFTLSRLMDFDVEGDGISPAEIFGLDRDQMTKLLSGMSINYPDFINASFTLGLDNITLREEKTSADVLDLF